MEKQFAQLIVPKHLTATMFSIVFALIWIIFLHITLPDTLASILLDKNSQLDIYPFTIQNFMWIIFFIGLSEIFLRYKYSTQEIKQLRLELLPEDESTLLRSEDLGAVLNKIKKSDEVDAFFLQRLIKRIILQFQTSQSVSQANSLLNSNLDLYMHEIELRYNMLRYIVWFIPTLGFIGTITGIWLALDFAGLADYQDPQLLSQLSSKLSVAFTTTLLALLLSALLVFLMHIVQGMEERSLNQSGQYCIDNLINRLYENP